MPKNHMTDKNDISLYAPTQQSNVVRLPKGRDPDKPGFPPPPHTETLYVRQDLIFHC